MLREKQHALMVAAGVAAAVLAPLAAPANAEPPSPSVHVVEPGETLWRIADGAGVDAATLASLNDLADPDAVSVGQVLRLPTAPRPPTPSTGPTVVTVAERDTLWSIAQRFGTSVDALARANGLDDPNQLSAGARLTIPDGGSPPSAAAPTPTPEPAAPASTPAAARPPRRGLVTSYTIRPGETLTRIARQFGTRADAIAQASGLEDPDHLSVGTLLKVPVPGRERVVQPGETLRDIAAQERVDLGALIDLNELTDPERIRAGDTLLLPGAPSEAPASGPPPTSTLPTPTPSASPSPAPAPTPRPEDPPGAPGQAWVALARKLVGARYTWGGSSPSGFDCSGLVWYLSRQLGKPVPRGMLGQYNSGPHPPRDGLKPGDLVFFQNTYTPGLSHAGVYLGSDQFVHAVDETAGVAISSLSSAFWTGHWFGATRLP